MSLTQNDAINMSLAIGSAMMKNDKQTREFLYEDLEPDDLKRVLRWTTRHMLNFFAIMSQMNGVSPEELPESWETLANIIREAAQQVGDQD